MTVPFTLELDTSGLRVLTEAERAECLEDRDLAEAAEDLDSAALLLCDLLEEAGGVFRAGGFDQEPWRVDVRFDLASIVPQLPALLESLESGEQAELDFFEQGTQRAVTAAYDGDRVRLQCRSYGKWRPQVPSEAADRAEFARMVRGLARGFAESLDVVAPEVAGFAPFAEWRSL